MAFKKLIYLILISISLLLYFSTCILASDEGQSSGSAAFLVFSVGARPAALGGAFTAIANDANSVFYNPGGMVQLTRNELTTMHTELWADIKYDYISYVHLLGARGKGQGASRENPASSIKHPASKALGLSFIRLDAGTQEARDRFQNLTGHFSANDTAIILAYSQRLSVVSNNLSAGISLKYIKQEIKNESGKACDLDIGFLYNPLTPRPLKPLKMGLILQNILTSKINWTTGSKEPLPFILKVGLSYIPKNSNLLTAVDVKRIQHEPTWKIHAGLEYKIGENLLIRIGSDDGNTTAGAGITYQEFLFDYAYVTHERLGNKHRVSLGIKF